MVNGRNKGNSSKRNRGRGRRRETSNDEETRVYSPGSAKSRPPRKKPWKMIFIFILAIVAGLVLSGVFSTYNFMRSLNPGPVSNEVTQDPGPSDRINILLLGVDGGVNGNGDKLGKGPKRSDTMVVLSIDPDLHQAGILNIPRDTRVRIPGRSGYDKITHAHAYGGPTLSVKTVEDFLRVPIHYYARVDFEGFINIIDILDGIEMDIEENMYYPDPVQGLLIDLKAGHQVLYGKEALDFVRYRKYIDADIGRVRAQQKFFAAVIDKFFQMKTIWKLPSLAREIGQHVETNMDPDDMVRMAGIAARMDMNSIEMAMVPGRDAMITDRGHTLSYWVADKPQLEKIVDRLLRGIDREANALIRVEVLNGTGIAGLARELADRLTSEGYTVSSIGNHSENDTKQTRVMNHVEEKDSANSIVRALRRQGLEPRVYRDIRPTGEEDVKITIIVGEDFAKKTGDGGSEDEQ